MAFQKWPSPQEGLSKRAAEILWLLAQGLSDREIADQLVVTVNTVKWYNRQIYSILGVGSRTQAIIRARELQLLDDGAERAPALNVVRRLPVHSLPAETTHFIGRKVEKQLIRKLLDTARVVTLVGPPGTGKTRLALKVAYETADQFADGVYFVSLAPLREPGLVANAMAAAIGISQVPGAPVIETLSNGLRESHLLLVLDNFEHLLPAATQVSELLTSVPGLNVLATSREPLHIYGEQEYAVPPLELPDLETSDTDMLTACESVALFTQQARAVRLDFELTRENAQDVAAICLRLEGLPLAIELAAARIKLLSPKMLLERLENRLDTLVGGAQNLPARQQTIRSTIGWSYDLLDEGEKQLLARLTVFRGGCSLEAVEAVCGEGLAVNVFNGLTSLVDKSLILHKATASGEPRFSMLETIHDYAWEKLNASGEFQTIQLRHADYFMQLTERAEPELRQHGFAYWMGRLGEEEDNLRSALGWSLEGGAVEIGMRLVASMRDFWAMSGRFSQGQHWTRLALSIIDSAAPHLQVRLLIAVGAILYISPQRTLQKQTFLQAIELARAMDDPLNLAWGLIFLGATYIRETTGWDEGLAAIEEAMAIFRQFGHKPGMVQALNLVGELHRHSGADEAARAAYIECLELAGETGEVRREAMMLCNLGFLAMHKGDAGEARQLFSQGLVKAWELGHDKRLIVTSILLLGDAIAATGEPEVAVRLFGAADALFKPNGVGLSPSDQPEHERILALVRDQLDAVTFQSRWDEGHLFTLEQAVDYALELQDSQPI